MTKKTFLRRDNKRFSKFGKKRKKLLSWRKPKGRDNKMREKRRGYSTVVKIGYSTGKDNKNKIDQKIPVKINNIKELEKMKSNQIAVIGNVGKKKRIEIANRAKEIKVKIHNMNPELFLKKLNKKKKENETK